MRFTCGIFCPFEKEDWLCAPQLPLLLILSPLEMTVVSKDPFSHLSISHGPDKDAKDEKDAGYLESEGGWQDLQD